MQVLIAFEDAYRFYREILAYAIEENRPHVRVATARAEAIEEEVERFEPHLVICDLPEPGNPLRTLGWVEMPPTYMGRSKIRVGERHSEVSNPTLEGLLAVLDETERLAGTECA